MFSVPLDPFILKYHVSCVIFSCLLLRTSQQKLPYTAPYMHFYHKTMRHSWHRAITILTHVLVAPGFNLVLKEALLTNVFRGIPQEFEVEATSKWARILLLTTIPRQYHRPDQ
jgi:hypothetical protein